MGGVMERRFKRAAYLLVAGTWAVVILSTWVRLDGYQWDFKSYYFAGKALEQGLNPYLTADLAKAAGDQGAAFRFVYPLSALYALKPLSALDYATAWRLWLVVKILALAALLLLWKREFLKDTEWLWILTVGLFAFQATTLWDIKAGNVSTFEQLFLWIGFAFLLRSRTLAFAACVVAAAWFKLTLSAFLLLLLLPPLRNGKNILVMVAAFAVLGGVSLGSFATHPGLLHDFMAGASVRPKWLTSSPSIYSVATEVVRYYVKAPGLQWLAYAVAGATTVALLVIGRRLIGRAYRSASLIHGILIACFCYALVAPRMMVYSYMIVIVPFLACVVPAARRYVAGGFATAIIVCMGGLKILPANVGKFAADSEPVLLLVACWLFLVFADRKGHLFEPTGSA